MATMNSGLGGPTGYGENVFSSSAKFAGNNDDGSVQVEISSVFGGSGVNYFGTNYTNIYINSNGLITFDGPQTGYSPSGVAGLTEPAIVPFWSDADISKGGDIYWDLDPSAGTVTITWLNVAPYTGSGTNSFQVVLTDNGGGDFDVELIYEDIQWSNGGYGVATAGITDGGTVDFELEGSGNSTSVLSYDSNDFDGGDPVGTFILSVEDGVPSIYSVDGTSSNDTLGLGFVDAGGDQITTGDDQIDAGAGNDVVDGDTGDDTISGGAGDDTILSGSSGGGAVSWTTVNNSADLTGTGDQNYYSWTAGNGSTATVRLNNSAGAGDGDGVADYIRVETTEQTGTLTVGDFDMGTDKIVLQEMYTGISFTSGSGNHDVTITYGNGNTQNFLIYTSGAFDASEVFTTTEPTGGVSDNDSLSGGDGADTFLIANSSGSDTIVGGEGGTDSDTVDLSSLSGPVTVTYSGGEAGTTTDGGDTLMFSEVENLILSDQNDSLGGSSDTSGLNVVAGAGDDTVVGGTGNDTLSGGDGDDYIDGGDGDDFLTTGLGNDTLIGGDGNDTLMNSDGDDSLVGGAGDDSIVATGGDDTLEGGDGNDTLIGGIHNDSVEGGAGNDVIYSGSAIGTDGLTATYSEQTGVSDSFTGTNGNADFTGTTTTNGPDVATGTVGSLDGYWIGNGGDADEVHTHTFSTEVSGARILFNAINSGETFGFIVDGQTFDLNTAIANGEVTFDGGSNYEIDGGGAITFSSGGVTQETGTVTFHQPFTTLGASVGGTSGNGVIYEMYVDTNPPFHSDDDYLSGGDDADLFIIEVDFGNDTIVGGEGGTDSDTIDGSSATSDLTVTLSSDEVGTITDGADIVSFSQIENIVTGSGADILNASGDSSGLGLFGNAGDDIITGGSGADYIVGGDDADTIVINDGFGTDIIFGGEGGTDSDTIDLTALTGPVTVTYSGDEAGIITDGTDTLTFSEVENIFLTAFDDSVDGSADSIGVNLFADDGDDSVTGGTGDDSIDGGTGNDTIDGGDGNDSITAGAGNDSIEWSDGADTVFAGDGDDRIDGGGFGSELHGGNGNDYIQVGWDGVTAYGDAGDDTIYGVTGDETTYGGDGNDRFILYQGDDVAFGGAGSDTIDGGYGNDSLNGEGDDDSITGGAGTDTIWGDAGNDTVDGGADDDSLIGGTGNDNLTGGSGNDTFTYSIGDGHDTISDFNTGNTGTLSDGENGNNDFINLTGFYDNLSELYADLADDDRLNQSNTTDSKGRSVDYTDNSEFGASDSMTFTGASADNSSFTQENTGVVCFSSGTAIRTPCGDVLIDDLRVGDLVTTMDNGPQRIRWIGTRKLGTGALKADERLRPVLIPQGVLGAERDLLVSRQHAVLWRRDQLVRAIHLIGSNGVRIAHGKRKLTYIHLMFDTHQILFAENAPTESFYPGPIALEMFEGATRTEFFQEFPQFNESKGCKASIIDVYGATARPLSQGIDIGFNNIKC